MMWKETYRLGIKSIDEQHIQLFQMTEDLVKAVQKGASVREYQKALAFLKEYVVCHFREEEAYQASIQYEGLPDHQEEHRQFTRTVQKFEQRLMEDGFSEKAMKDLVGAVTAWLVYHVAGADQKIVAGSKGSAGENVCGQSAELFSRCAQDVLETMAGLEAGSVQREETSIRSPQGDILIRIRLVGDVKGDAVFAFSQELALHLFQAMTGMELEEMDELVQSALCELTNIACGNAATAFTQRGLQCDIKPPELLDALPEERGGVVTCLHTPLGAWEISVAS